MKLSRKGTSRATITISMKILVRVESCKGFGILNIWSVLAFLLTWLDSKQLGTQHMVLHSKLHLWTHEFCYRIFIREIS